MASLISKASLLMVPSVYEDGTLYNVLPSGNKAPDETGSHNGYDQTRADFTFSRGSNLAATRRNSSGLIEKGRENLLLQSNTFDTTWTTYNANTPTSGQSGYDGTSDAWLFESTANGGQLIQSVAYSGVNTLSIYAKQGSVTQIQIRFATASPQTAIFDLSSGSFVSSNGTIIYKNIESITDGWYRVSLSVNATTGTQVNIYPFSGGSTTAGSIYIQDAQLELGLVSTPVIRTGATTATAGVLENTPRIDYSSGAGALLLEPSRTNKITNSEYFGGYTQQNATLTTNATTSPEGVKNASLLTESTANGNHQQYTSVSGFSIGDSITISVFAKSNGRDEFRIDFVPYGNTRFDLSNGTITNGSDATIEDYGNGWYRCSVTRTATSTTTGVYFTLWNGSAYYTGDGTSGVYFYGASFEIGSHVSSYVPTYGSAVTRGADSCSVTGASDILNDSEGTLFVEMSALANDQTSRRLSISDGTNNNRVMIGYSTGSNAVQFVLSDGGAVVVNSAHTLSDIKETAKIAFKYQLNNCEMYINGSRVILDTTATMPSGLSVLGFYQGATNENLHANMKQLAYFPEALSDSELATLTTL